MIRSMEYNKYGTIDLEFNHPDFGWIPYTANPNDVEEIGRIIYAEAVSGKYGNISPYIKKPMGETK